MNKDLIAESKVVFLKDNSEGITLEPTIENFGWDVVPIILYNKMSTSKKEIIEEYFMGLDSDEIVESLIVFHGEDKHLSRVTVGSLLEAVAELDEAEDIAMFGFEPTQGLKILPPEYKHVLCLSEIDSFSNMGVVDFYKTSMTFESLFGIAMDYLGRSKRLTNNLELAVDYVKVISRNCDLMSYSKLGLVTVSQEYLTYDYLLKDNLNIEDVVYHELSNELSEWLETKTKGTLYQITSLTLVLAMFIYYKTNKTKVLETT